MALFVFYITIMLVENQNDSDWFFDDFEEKIERVSEGELEFLPEPPEEKVHFHSNQLVIGADSLKTGWARLSQCHENMDALDIVQITFNRDTTRKLEVLSYSKITRAWVDQTNVELEGVQKGAKLCLQLESRVLHFGEGKHMSVRNGPYMRKFLDGYYPMHVYLEVSYPCQLMRFIKTGKQPQPGFNVSTKACAVMIDAWFAGELYTDLLFERL
jgi:hypothetical protein